MLRGLGVRKSAQIGCLAGGAVVQTVGAEMSPANWQWLFARCCRLPLGWRVHAHVRVCACACGNMWGRAGGKGVADAADAAKIKLLRMLVQVKADMGKQVEKRGIKSQDKSNAFDHHMHLWVQFFQL